MNDVNLKKWNYRQGPVEICFSFFCLIYHESLHVGFHDFHSHFLLFVFVLVFIFSSMFFYVPLLICHVCSIPRTKPAKTEANQSKNEQHQ